MFLTAQESGKASQVIPDLDVLTYATSLERAVLTFNRRDFIKLHSTNPDHAGIIVCTFDTDATGLANRIHGAIKDLASLKGMLIRINRPAT